MILKNKYVFCIDFFNELCEKLSDTHERVDSPTTKTQILDQPSVSLVPNGTINELTYYGKPEKSFRVSMHWNWYASLKKCNKPNYIQCYSSDFPWPRKRKDNEKASDPILAASVCVFINGKYHVVYGEKYDRKTSTWSWIESTPDEVIEEYLNQFGGSRCSIKEENNA